jgi:hypothetical protein
MRFVNPAYSSEAQNLIACQYKVSFIVIKLSRTRRLHTVAPNVNIPIVAALQKSDAYRLILPPAQTVRSMHINRSVERNSDTVHRLYIVSICYTRNTKKNAVF